MTIWIAIIAILIGVFIVIGILAVMANARTNKTQRVAVTLLLNELDNLAKELGYENFLAHQEAKNGKEDAQRVATDIKNLLDSLGVKGPVGAH